MNINSANTQKPIVVTGSRGGFYRTSMNAAKQAKAVSPGIGKSVNMGNAQTPHRPGEIIPTRGAGMKVPLKVENNTDTNHKIGSLLQQPQTNYKSIQRNPIIVNQQKAIQSEERNQSIARHPVPPLSSSSTSTTTSSSSSTISLAESTSFDSSLNSNDSLKDEIDKLKGLLISKDGTINNLRAKISINDKELNAKIQDREKKISDLKEEVKYLKKSITGAKQFQGSSQSIISTQSSSSITTSSSSQSHGGNFLEFEKKQLQLEVDSANAQHQNLETQIKSKTAILKQLEIQISQKKRFLDELERNSIDQQPLKRSKLATPPQKTLISPQMLPKFNAHSPLKIQKQSQQSLFPEKTSMKHAENTLQKRLLQLNLPAFFADFPFGPQILTSIIPGILNGTIKCGCLLLKPLEQIISHELSSSLMTFGPIMNALTMLTEIILSCRACKDSVCGCIINGANSNSSKTCIAVRTLSNSSRDINISRFVTPPKSFESKSKERLPKTIHENTEILDIVIKNICTLCTPLNTELCSITLRFICTCLNTQSDTSSNVNSSSLSFATLTTYGEKILESGVLKSVLSSENKSFAPQTRELALEVIEILMQGFRPVIVSNNSSSEVMTTEKRSLLDDVVYVLGAESFGSLADMRHVRLRAVHMFLHAVVESNAILEQDAAPDSLPIVAATNTQHSNGTSSQVLRTNKSLAINSEYLVKGVCALLEHELNNAFSSNANLNENAGCKSDALKIIQVTSSLISCFQSDLFPSIDDVSEMPGIISKLKKFAAISSDIELNISASKLERLTSTQFSQTQQ